MPARILPFGPLAPAADHLVSAAADPALLTRILRRCQPDDAHDSEACMVWQGATATQGKYGITTVDAQPRLVHRAAYLAAYGDLVPGSIGHETDSVEVHHTCENRLCCNPRHLAALTRRQHNQEHAALRLAA